MNYFLKLKAFRILLVYKFFDQNYKKWKEIVGYWFQVNLYSISRIRWDIRFPHSSCIDNVPPFFKKCIIEFKEYYRYHQRCITKPINTKIIYWDLVHEINHVPASIRRNPENKFYFETLTMNKFADPYLREFLFRLYHWRLVFKRFKLNINDMLNTGQRCNLCSREIDTPVHCFQFCSYGHDLRIKRDTLIGLIKGTTQISITEENYTFCNINTSSNIDNILNFINALSNYSMYTVKLKKFLDPSIRIEETESLHIFTKKLKQRIFCDHLILKINEFVKIWDTNCNNGIVSYNEQKITSWNF